MDNEVIQETKILGNFTSDVRPIFTPQMEFIVNDYKERFFTKSLEKIARAHRDSKKQIKNKLANLSDSQLQALSKALLKIEKENSQHTHTEINTSAV